MEHLDHAACLAEGLRAGGERVEHGAEREDVDWIGEARSSRATRGAAQLGSTVGGRAEAETIAGRIVWVGEDGGIEVAELDVEAVCEQHVLLFDVGVHAALVVKEDDGFDHLMGPVEPLLQIDAVSVLPGVEGEVVRQKLEQDEEARRVGRGAGQSANSAV